MKKLNLWVLFMLFTVAQCQASGLVSPDATIQGDDADNAQYVDMDEFCQTNPCRKNVHFYLLTEQGKIDEEAPLYWPVVQGDRISVLAGEKVLIEAKLAGKQFGDFVAVKASNKAISFDLSQSDDHLGMMLVVKNPHDVPIKISIDMIDFEGNLHETSSCPVIAGGSIFEMWPHPIPEILISNIRKHDDSEGMACEY